MAPLGRKKKKAQNGSCSQTGENREKNPQKLYAKLFQNFDYRYAPGHSP